MSMKIHLHSSKVRLLLKNEVLWKSKILIYIPQRLDYYVYRKDSVIDGTFNLHSSKVRLLLDILILKIMLVHPFTFLKG